MKDRVRCAPESTSPTRAEQPAQGKNQDLRLQNVILAEDAFYRHLVNYPPRKARASAEPRMLDFLYLIVGFHLHTMPSPRLARTRQLYDLLLVHFLRLTAQLSAFVSKDFYLRICFGDGTVTVDEQGLVSALYARYGIPERYSLRSLIYRLYTLAAIVVQNPSPHIQTIYLNDLPRELVLTIAAHLPMSAIRKLSQTSSRYREFLYRLCRKEASFVIHYDHSASHRHAWSARRYVDILESAVARARRDCTATVLELLGDLKAIAPLEHVSFHNEWESLLPLQTIAYSPSPLDDIVFGELFASVTWMLYYTRLKSLRLSGLGLPARLVQRVAKCVTLTRLTLESCIIQNAMIESLSPSLRMPNITFLTIGFGGTPRSTSMECWSVVLFCVNLRHLFIYPVDDNTIIHYPAPSFYHHMQHLHKLQKLHIQGGSAVVAPLAAWIRSAAELCSPQVPGGLTHFKLQTVIGSVDSEISPLLDTLAEFHPNIRVLAIEGVVDAIQAIRQIASTFAGLEGLSIIRKQQMYQKTIRLCQWGVPSYNIAQILGGLQHLRHFAGNLDYTINTFGPAAYSMLAYPPLERNPTPASIPSDIEAIRLEHVLLPGRPQTVEDSCACQALLERRDHCDSLMDGLAIARAFAAYCTLLSSFAIKTDVTSFSCRISRDVDGHTNLYDVIDYEVLGGFESWSPLHFETWSESD